MTREPDLDKDTRLRKRYTMAAVGIDGSVVFKLGVFAIFAALVVAVALNSVVAAGIAFGGLVVSLRFQRQYEARRLHGIKRRRRRRS